jgi:hypothetical protein
MSTRRLAVVLFALIAAALGLVFMGGPVDDDEKVRRVVQAIAEAAEDSNTGDILDVVSDRYSDDDGLDKKMLQAMLARQFLTRGRILVVLGPIAVDRQESTATATFEAVIAEGAEGLGLSADAQGFIVELELEEDDWMVVSHTRYDVGGGL